MTLTDILLSLLISVLGSILGDLILQLLGGRSSHHCGASWQAWFNQPCENPLAVTSREGIFILVDI